MLNLPPDAVAIEQELGPRLPFLDDAAIAGLQPELPAYLAECNGCQEMSDLEKV